MTMMMIMHAIVLFHWKYSQRVDMSLDLDTLSWSCANQSCSYSLMLCVYRTSSKYQLPSLLCNPTSGRRPQCLELVTMALIITSPKLFWLKVLTWVQIIYYTSDIVFEDWEYTASVINGDHNTTGANSISSCFCGGHCDRDRLVVGLKTTCAISPHHH